MQIHQKFNVLMSLNFLLFTCCADFSTGDRLIIRRKYPNAPESESELFTVDTSECQSFSKTMSREISPQLSPEKLDETVSSVLHYVP